MYLDNKDTISYNENHFYVLDSILFQIVFLKVVDHLNNNVFIKIYGRNNIIILTLKNCAFTAKLMNINNVHVALNLPCVYYIHLLLEHNR